MKRGEIRSVDNAMLPSIYDDDVILLTYLDQSRVEKIEPIYNLLLKPWIASLFLQMLFLWNHDDLIKLQINVAIFVVELNFLTRL